MNFNPNVFLTTFLVSFSLAFLLFALVPGSTLMFLAKLLALAFAITLSSPLWYPHIRGIKPGDRVIIESLSPLIKPKSRFGTVNSPGRVGEVISVIGDDGEEYKCKIVSYPGTFSKAKVRVVDDFNEVKVQ